MPPMNITYNGHASFKLRGKTAACVTDPFSSDIGFSMPRVSADIVTVSHDHRDHNDTGSVSGTARRDEPFVIKAPGEYEVLGVSVFGLPTFHDAKEGSERGKNTIFVIHVDGVSITHLGDLGHGLSNKQVEEIGEVDVLLVPVGGFYTIGPRKAVEVISQLQPSLVIPMHYRTKKHDDKTFGKLSKISDFLKEGGYDQAQTTDKLSVSKSSLPEEMEVVVLKS